MTSPQYDLTHAHRPVVVDVSGPRERPSAWVAGPLGFLLPGLGHLYMGRPLAAAAWWLGRWPAIILFLMPVFSASAPGDRFIALITAPALMLGYMTLSGLNARNLAGEPWPGERPAYTRWWALLLAAGLIVAIDVPVRSLVLSRLPVRVYRVSGHSMLPAMLPDDRFVGVRVGEKFVARHGMLVTYRSPEEDHLFVGRVVATGGETVEIRNFRATVNGFPERTKVVISDASPSDGEAKDVANRPPMKVPPGEVYVLGDNRTNSRDSRVFGSIPLENLVATPSWWLIRHGPNGRILWFETGESVRP